MSRNIIVADDSRANRMIIKSILTNHLEYINILEAEHGGQVLDLLETNEVELIILDLIMPVLDGYETLVKVKSNPKYKDIPIIVSSAITNARSIKLTLEKGALDYFTKPFSVEESSIIMPLKAKNALKLYEQTKLIKRLNEEITNELKNANAFQHFMLPKNKSLKGIKTFIKYQPSMGIGGDFFDSISIGERSWFMIADVAGHGIAAGMASSMLKMIFRNGAKEKDISPSGLLAHINEQIFENFPVELSNKYLVFSAFIGLVEDNNLHYANAGQPYPVYCSKEGCRMLEENGFLVGVFKNCSYQEHLIPMEKGDKVILYTDGLFSNSSGDIVEWEKVISYARTHKDHLEQDPDGFLKSILEYFFRMHLPTGGFTDDVALMVVEKE